jgi:hypothetical protein
VRCLVEERDVGFSPGFLCTQLNGLRDTGRLRFKDASIVSPRVPAWRALCNRRRCTAHLDGEPQSLGNLAFRRVYASPG